ncbi:MAG: molybdenum cofactor guanylyltransferase [Candidatus Woesearchaeota archaeon]
MSLILLAGGKNTRINTDKAFLELNGKTIIENTINSLKNIFEEIIIVANNVEDYKFLGYKVIPDLVKDKGPLGGIYTGLKASKDDCNFILGCDMPFVNADLVKYMLGFDEFDTVIPKINDNVEPLHALYSKNILPIIENQIKNNKLKIREMIEKIEKIKYIEREEIEKFDKKNICFFNINNEDDLEKARELLK